MKKVSIFLWLSLLAPALLLVLENAPQAVSPSWAASAPAPKLPPVLSFATAAEGTTSYIVGYIVPFIFVYQPALLLKGSTGEVLLAAATAIIGTIALAGAMSGFFFGAVFWWQRILLGAGSLTLIYPGWRTDLLGLALVAIAMAGTRLARALALPGVRPAD